MNEQDLVNEYFHVEAQLSPENLYCDGERSRAEAAPIARRLIKRRNEIVAVLGREPHYSEFSR